MLCCYSVTSSIVAALERERREEETEEAEEEKQEEVEEEGDEVEKGNINGRRKHRSRRGKERRRTFSFPKYWR